jgi:prophage antirepressor-like protein
MSEIQMFDNGEFELRVTQVGESFTVSGPSLARALGFPDASRMVRNLPTDEKGRTLESTPGGPQETYFVTEPGFYHIVGQRQPGRIKDPTARAQVERFQRWVHHEVLPSIRRHGRYQLDARVIEGEFDEPHTLTWDEFAATLRQRYGLHYTAAQLTRILRTHGVLKQTGAPRKDYVNFLWWTGSAWNVHPHVVRQLAQKVVDGTRELREFRFIQAHLELDGIGSPASIEHTKEIL